MTTAAAPLSYYYEDFWRALRRFRRVGVLSWAIVAAGFLALASVWRTPGMHGVLDILLCILTMVAGLVAAHVNVSSLGDYIARAPVRRAADRPEEGDDAAASELEGVMDMVRDGGWQEALAAIGLIRRIGERHGLPPLP